MSILTEIRDCTLCADRFAQTKTAHAPRPVAWFHQRARILIAGQAPGMRVHISGKPFDDPSGDRLRDWMGLDATTFYDKSRIAIVPMAFCFPGYDKNGSDLAPPKLCRDSWHDKVFDFLPTPKVRLIVGGYAQKYHLQTRLSVTDTVRNWRSYGEVTFPLPHPSWRNTAWLKRNPWFEEDVLPVMRQRIQEALHD